MRVTSATGSGGGTQSGSFRGGAFVVTQTTAPGGLTDLRLTGGSFAGCTRAHTAAAKRLPSSVVRLLRATVSGRFRTNGRLSSATVRGTQWDTVDRCDGTQTHVIRGVVVVHDFRTAQDTVLTAGKSFLAAASGSAAPTPAPSIGEARMTQCPPSDVNNPFPAGTVYTFAGVLPGAPAGTLLRIEYLDPNSQTGLPVVDRVTTGAGGAFTDTHAFPATGFTYLASATPRYPDDPLGAGQPCSFEVR